MDNDRYFVSCDWGSAVFRLYLVKLGAPLQIVDSIANDFGALTIARDNKDNSRSRVSCYEQVLCEGIDELSAKNGLDVGSFPVVISGMASSSIGWRELPYAEVPFRVDGRQTILDELLVSTLARVVLVSGLQTQTDILRGEETHVVGLFADQVANQSCQDCVMVLPGTYCKHLLITDGAVRDFRTYMTGELYNLIRENSILRESIGFDLDVAKVEQQQDWPAFIEGATLAQERRLSSALFRVRTNDLLQGMPKSANASYMSGLLFGNELAGMRDEYPNDLPVVLIGGQFSDAYQMLFSFVAPEQELEVISQEDADLAFVRGQAILLDYIGG